MKFAHNYKSSLLTIILYIIWHLQILTFLKINILKYFQLYLRIFLFFQSADSQAMEGGGDHREARRPMNSFFIFCKRHRSMVRDYHHNLDNRSISRILGELWATLDPKQKQQYTATAKQVSFLYYF